MLPNGVAASQVTINLTDANPRTPLAVVIRVSRESDLTKARETAQRIARATPGVAAACGVVYDWGTPWSAHLWVARGVYGA